MSRSAEDFASVADVLPEPLLLLTPAGAILRGNAAFLRTFGFSAADLTGAHLQDFVDTDEPRLTDYLRRCAGTRQMLYSALTIRRRTGEAVPCRCEGAVVSPSTDASSAEVLLRFVPKEQSASRFVALTQKLADLNAEVARRRQAEERLLEQRELLEVTLTSIGDAVIATDASGRLTFMNRVAQGLTGWTLAAALGRPVEEVFRIVNEETRKPVPNPVTKVLALAQIVGLANHTVLIARDGSERPIDDSGAPILGPDGRLHGAVLVFRDVTELRRAEREQLAARLAAESANRAKDQFLATLSHELRTPLNAILGWCRLLTRGMVKEEQRQHGLTVIERNAEVQARLVEDLLDLSRITAGKLRLRSEGVDLAGVLQAAVDSIAPSAQSKNLRVTVSFDETPLAVVGDAERLQQVFWNLLTNAVKFTPAGGAIGVEAGSADTVVRVAIRDSGQGFKPGLKKYMFDPFSQGDASFSRPHGGLGLGLTIVRRIVEAHGGEIEADSAGAGRGATFVVTLPRSLATAAAPGADPSAGATAPFTNLSILLVDDEKDSTELMAIVLQGCGAAVAVANTARAALDRLRSEPFDLVLADIGMPHEDGFWLIREIRKLPGRQALQPVLAVTAFASSADRDAILTAGFAGHVAKPVDVDTLTAAIARARSQTLR